MKYSVWCNLIIASWLTLCLASTFSQAQEPGSAKEPATVDNPPEPPPKDQSQESEPSSDVHPQVAPDMPADNRANDNASVAKPDDLLLTRQYKRAMVIDVEGAIFGSLRSYMINRVERAKRSGVDLIILRINSPGGSLDASEELARMLGKIDWATTIAFIPESAYSGAAIMSLGCDRIFMEPRAIIGDAGPIVHDGGAFRFVEQKRVSAIAAMVHQLAEIKNRPGAIAEAMVDRTLVIHSATDKQTGQKTYLTAEEIKQPDNQQRYDIGPAIPESGQDRFLTVAGTRAVELTLAEGVFISEHALMDSLNVEDVVQTRRTWVDQTVHILNLPIITGLLLLIGLVGLYLELSMPGLSIAGLVSLFCFAIFFWSHALGGTSGWLEVMLFALGVSCVVIEIFVLPGFGVFGISGVSMVALSLVMASQDFILPQTNVQWVTLRNNLLIVLATLAIVGVTFIVQVLYFDWIPGLNKLKLQAPEDAASAALVNPELSNDFRSSTVFQPSMGQRGTADSVLRPAGKVRFSGHLVDVVTEGDFLDPGTEVEVVNREGNRIVVRRI